MVTTSLFNTVLAIRAGVISKESIALVIANTKFNNYTDAIKGYWHDWEDYADPRECAEILISIWDKVVQPRRLCSLLSHCNKRIWFDTLEDFYMYQVKMGYGIIVPQYKAILKNPVY